MKFVIKARDTPEDKKTVAEKVMENKMQKEHDKLLWESFVGTITHPGHILLKYPNSYWGSRHNRRVVVKGIEIGQQVKSSAILMWAVDKSCKVKDIQSIIPGKGTGGPWGGVTANDRVCFTITT